MMMMMIIMMTHSRSRIQLPDNKHSQGDELCVIVSIAIHLRVKPTGVLQVKKKISVSLMGHAVAQFVEALRYKL
jgi:hypothetical protein